MVCWRSLACGVCSVVCNFCVGLVGAVYWMSVLGICDNSRCVGVGDVC